MTNDTTITLSPALIRCERGERLLLMDGERIAPLLIQDGKVLVDAFLADCARLGNRRAILAAHPDANLLDAFLAHGILRDEAAPAGKAHPACQGRCAGHEEEGK